MTYLNCYIKNMYIVDSPCKPQPSKRSTPRIILRNKTHNFVFSNNYHVMTQMGMSKCSITVMYGQSSSAKYKSTSSLLPPPVRLYWENRSRSRVNIIISDHGRRPKTKLPM